MFSKFKLRGIKMNKLPLIVSPADNSDWNNFLKTQPDLTDVIMWLRNSNIDFTEFLKFKTSEIDFSDEEPENIFEYEQLRDWAEENDFHIKLSDFDDEVIMNYVYENFDPTSVFGFDRLSEWADDNDYVNKDTIIDLLSEKIVELKNKSK